MISFTEELAEEWRLLKLRLAREPDDQTEALRQVVQRAVAAGRFVSRPGERHMLQSIATAAGEHLFQCTGHMPRTEPEELDYVAYFPPATRFFTGRDGFLQALRTALDPREGGAQTVAISGLGGMGKTQVALKYIQLHADVYGNCFWLKATRALDLDDGIRKMAEILGLCGLDDTGADGAVTHALVRDWLHGHSGWLLVLDDVYDPEPIADILPPRHQGRVLITTRRPELPGVRMLPLPEMTDDEGATLILRRAGSLSGDQGLADAPGPVAEQALRIAEALGNYPLALEQAGAYLTSGGGCPDRVQLDDFYCLVTREPVSNLLAVGRDPVLHASAVATIRLCLEQIDVMPEAAALARACAILAPCGIPEEIVRACVALAVDGNGAPLDETTWQEAVQRTGLQSLLAYDRVNGLLNMHAVVQKVVLDDLPPVELRRWIERWIAVLGPRFPTFREPGWRSYRPLFRHVLMLLDHCRALGVRTPEVARLAFESAQYLSFVIGDAAYAIELHDLAIDIRKAVYAPEHREVACALNAQGSAYFRLGDAEEAERRFLAALDMRSRLGGEHHPHVGRSHSRLGLLYRFLDRPDDAIPHLERAWQIGFGPDAVPVDSEDEAGRREGWRATWAWCLAQRGEIEEAERVYREACANRTRILGGTHPEVLENLRELAEFLAGQDRFDEAGHYWQQALEAGRRTSRCNPHIVKALDGLARLHRARGEPERAEQLFAEAAGMARELRAKPELVAVLDSWASLLESGTPEQAAAAVRLRDEARETQTGQASIPRHIYLNIYGGEGEDARMER